MTYLYEKIEDVLSDCSIDENIAIVEVIATYRNDYYKFNMTFDVELSVINTDCVPNTNEIVLSSLEDVYNLSAKQLVSLDEDVVANVLYSTYYEDENTITSNSDELLYYFTDIKYYMDYD